MPAPALSAPGSRTGLSSDDWQFRQNAITERLLTALEDVVWRYRALAPNGLPPGLVAEAVTAEVAHHLLVARDALRRLPIPD
ncbi:hypothetical protein [Pseudonocardia acaciae]|uniref:hypothetical protein n=1 Tax=Pseudonocardia acaciae TaxID=551276 RepID=UPI0012EE73B7|nr:hypothetical protein [Pseudonocardia acaciae]